MLLSILTPQIEEENLTDGGISDDIALSIVRDVLASRPSVVMLVVHRRQYLDSSMHAFGRDNELYQEEYDTSVEGSHGVPSHAIPECHPRAARALFPDVVTVPSHHHRDDGHEFIDGIHDLASESGAVYHDLEYPCDQDPAACIRDGPIDADLGEEHTEEHTEEYCDTSPADSWRSLLHEAAAVGRERLDALLLERMQQIAALGTTPPWRLQPLPAASRLDVDESCSELCEGDSGYVDSAPPTPAQRRAHARPRMAPGPRHAAVPQVSRPPSRVPESQASSRLPSRPPSRPGIGSWMARNGSGAACEGESDKAGAGDYTVRWTADEWDGESIFEEDAGMRIPPDDEDADDAWLSMRTPLGAMSPPPAMSPSRISIPVSTPPVAPYKAPWVPRGPGARAQRAAF